MSRALTLPILVLSVIAGVSLLVAGMLSPATGDKARAPLGDVRIEKIVDFQLPELSRP